MDLSGEAIANMAARGSISARGGSQVSISTTVQPILLIKEFHTYDKHIYTIICIPTVCIIAVIQ